MLPLPSVTRLRRDRTGHRAIKGLAFVDFLDNVDDFVLLLGDEIWRQRPVLSCGAGGVTKLCELVVALLRELICQCGWKSDYWFVVMMYLRFLSKETDEAKVMSAMRRRYEHRVTRLPPPQSVMSAPVKLLATSVLELYAAFNSGAAAFKQLFGLHRSIFNMASMGDGDKQSYIASLVDGVLDGGRQSYAALAALDPYASGDARSTGKWTAGSESINGGGGGEERYDDGGGGGSMTDDESDGGGRGTTRPIVSPTMSFPLFGWNVTVGTLCNMFWQEIDERMEKEYISHICTLIDAETRQQQQQQQIDALLDAVNRHTQGHPLNWHTRREIAGRFGAAANGGSGASQRAVTSGCWAWRDTTTMHPLWMHGNNNGGGSGGSVLSADEWRRLDWMAEAAVQCDIATRPLYCIPERMHSERLLRIAINANPRVFGQASMAARDCERIAALAIACDGANYGHCSPRIQCMPHMLHLALWAGKCGTAWFHIPADAVCSDGVTSLRDDAAVCVRTVELEPDIFRSMPLHIRSRADIAGRMLPHSPSMIYPHIPDAVRDDPNFIAEHIEPALQPAVARSYDLAACMILEGTPAVRLNKRIMTLCVGAAANYIGHIEVSLRSDVEFIASLCIQHRHIFRRIDWAHIPLMFCRSEAASWNCSAVPAVRPSRHGAANANSCRDAPLTDDE